MHCLLSRAPCLFHALLLYPDANDARRRSFTRAGVFEYSAPRQAGWLCKAASQPASSPASRSVELPGRVLRALPHMLEQLCAVDDIDAVGQYRPDWQFL